MYLKLAFLSELVDPVSLVLGTQQVPETIKCMVLGKPHPHFQTPVTRGITTGGREFICCQIFVLQGWRSAECNWLDNLPANVSISTPTSSAKQIRIGWLIRAADTLRMPDDTEVSSDA